MKNISIIIILVAFSLCLKAQYNADNIVAFKLYFKGKLVDSVKAGEFQILSQKGLTKEKNGESVDYKYESSCQCFLYSNNLEGSNGMCIVHVIDTMEFKLPQYLVYLEKVPFEKGKFFLK